MPLVIFMEVPRFHEKLNLKLCDYVQTFISTLFDYFIIGTGSGAPIQVSTTENSNTTASREIVSTHPSILIGSETDPKVGLTSSIKQFR